MKYFLTILAAFMLTACGGPPDEVVRAAIVKSRQTSSFTVKKWKETNSYTRKVNDEDIQYIEYEATLEIKPELKQYVNSSGGISFPSATVDVKGTTAIVKRGSSWYMAQ